MPCFVWSRELFRLEYLHRRCTGSVAVSAQWIRLARLTKDSWISKSWKGQRETPLGCARDEVGEPLVVHAAADSVKLRGSCKGITERFFRCKWHRLSVCQTIEEDVSGGALSGSTCESDLTTMCGSLLFFWLPFTIAATSCDDQILVSFWTRRGPVTGRKGRRQ
jgi:hypothetical protein